MDWATWNSDRQLIFQYANRQSVMTYPSHVALVSTQWLQEWIAAVSALGSLILTGALVYLYFRQTRIQQRQADIQDAQQTLLEAQAKPIVEYGPVDAEGNTVYMSLSNAGGGVATELQLVMEVEFTPRNGIQPAETAVPLEEHIQQEAPGEEEGFTLVRGGNSLKPYTEDTPFVGSPTLGIRSASDRTEYSFSDGIDYLIENDFTELRCTVYLQYTDPFGTSERDVILVGGGPLDSGTVL